MAAVKLISIQKYAFPLYWVLIVVLPLDNDAIPFSTRGESVRDREEERERGKTEREGTGEMKAINKVYPGSCALAEEGKKKLNKQGVRQRIGHHRSML